MAAGWWRDTSDNKLVAAADSAMDVPTGHDFILKTTIEAAYTGEIWQGGTWDGTDYEPPADILVGYDATSDAGMVKDAAHDMMDVFDAALALIAANPAVWTAEQREKAIEGIHWQTINTARIALNATRTAADRQKICEESASWPTMVNGNAREYVDAFGVTGVGLPTKDWFWIDLSVDPPVREEISMSGQHFASATNVEDAPTSDKLIGRAWIDDIPA